jgi:hypothetical protein
LQVLNVRPEPSGRGNTLARFDVQLDGMRLYNIALKHTANGYRVFAPSAFGGAVVTFTPETAQALIAAARGEIAEHDTARH